ncbi:helix-hairpin-helix domain-containing protein [Mucilaginibacter jinjuensis]|uniref:Helix-hairpin-helix domain-containing protein n=1 Tax=Mucilaginibacter jinjuensis TaxID=1176721 RepID=A0ABY7TB88_9SPHI|nr:helix-hairpin-helix domain-containing protein [Mucilaginibacter jinjuensis]WCT13607.1 helix-hairpin-helix domain-containing protein [Mucilaginibacter jinjuensis]
MKSSLKNYLSITKKEWNGLVVLVTLVVLVLLTPYAYRLFHKDKIINFNNFNADATQLPAEDSSNAANTKVLHPTLFAFNPNHLPAEQWLKLGLSQKQIDVLKHYEDKGGRFYKKSDVQKIYSITLDDYKRLEPYIQLPADGPASIIDINHADSASLVTLKGIGPAYAMRIIRYRDKLGGFYSKEQLKEVFGIDEEHYLLIKDAIKLNPSAIHKVNINKATFDDLRRYPYLSYKQANAIIQYRSEHGDYDNLDDMKDIAILDEATLNKVKPYWLFK